MTNKEELNIGNNAFNAIRLLCCIIVIYEHCVVLAGLDYICLDLRGMAVNVFFILSGFWVTRSYIFSKSHKEYFIKRIKKIFPLYLGVVIVCALIFSLFSTYSFKEYFFSGHMLKYLIANVSTMNFICPSLPGVFNGRPINGSLWTIKVELGFYIVLPIIIFVYNKVGDKIKNLVLLIIYVASVIYAITMPYICISLGLPDSLVNQLPAYMTYFVCGMFFMLNWNWLSVRKNNYLLVLISFVIVVIDYFIDVVLLEMFNPIALTVLLMFFAFNMKNLNSIGAKRDYSYRMYLFHYPIIEVCLYLGYFENYSFIGIITVISISFLISHLLYGAIDSIKRRNSGLA